MAFELYSGENAGPFSSSSRREITADERKNEGYKNDGEEGRGRLDVRPKYSLDLDYESEDESVEVVIQADAQVDVADLDAERRDEDPRYPCLPVHPTHPHSP